MSKCMKVFGGCCCLDVHTSLHVWACLFPSSPLNKIKSSNFQNFYQSDLKNRNSLLIFISLIMKNMDIFSYVQKQSVFLFTCTGSSWPFPIFSIELFIFLYIKDLSLRNVRHLSFYYFYFLAFKNLKHSQITNLLTIDLIFENKSQSSFSRLNLSCPE